MLRQLLTLLAVFTGLTVAVEPARALDAGVHTVHLAESAAVCQAQAGVHAEHSEDRRRQRVEKQDQSCRRPVIDIHVPTVMLQADRAHE